MPGIFFLASFPAWPASTCSPCLHLSVPPGDSGSPPPWRTTQPAPFSASSPLEARALSHPAPRPRRLCVLGQPPLSSLRSPLPSSGRRSISLGLPPTTAPPRRPPQPLLLPPHPSVSPKPSLCPPICHRQPWAHSPEPRPPGPSPPGSAPSQACGLLPSFSPTRTAYCHLPFPPFFFSQISFQLCCSFFPSFL